MLDAIQKTLDFEGYRNPQFNRSDGLGRVGVAGFVTGLVFGIHLSILGCCVLINGLVLSRLVQWSLYACSVSFFHSSEFFVTAVFKPDVVSYNSFVLNHSKEYTAALLSSWVEFWLEAALLPFVKRQPVVVAVGAFLAVMGHFFRVGAMCTAGSNFNHEIMQRREQNHQLITHGVYRFLRHPSYFGWFWWSLGTQLLLCNPICLLVYVAAASVFFRRRIPYEETLLELFYPDQYPAYVQRTFVGIPFVRSRSSRQKGGTTRAGTVSAPLMQAVRVSGAGGSRGDDRGVGGGNGRRRDVTDNSSEMSVGTEN